MTVCEGARVMLDGSGSVGCALPLYQWLEGVTPLCPASSSPTCGVVPTGTSTYTLELHCDTCSACVDAASITVTVMPDPIPPDQGNILRAVKQSTDVVLDFAGAAAIRWRLYRDGSKPFLGASALTPDTTTTKLIDVGAVTPPPALWFYRVKGLSPCSFTPGP